MRLGMSTTGRFYSSLRHCREICFFSNARSNNWAVLNGRLAALIARKLLRGENELVHRLKINFQGRILQREELLCMIVFVAFMLITISCCIKSQEGMTSNKKISWLSRLSEMYRICLPVPRRMDRVSTGGGRTLGS